MDNLQHPTSPYALVVDDDELVRTAAMDILEEAGFQTLEAVTGDLAIPALQQHHRQIILLFTDVQMPGSRNGFALAREAARSWPHISIVVASGQIRPGPGDLPEGACFIAKPFSAEVVHGHLQEILPDHQKPAPLKS